MALFIFAIIFFVIAVAGFVLARYGKKQLSTVRARESYSSYDESDPKFMMTTGYVVLGVFLVGALVTGFFSTFTTVGTKNVGVVTAFGKPTGELSNGAHFIAPWETVHEMDAAVQPESFTQEQSSNDQNHRCVDVRLGNQSIGCAEVRFNWQIQPKDARALYQTYRSFDHLRNTLVLGALRSALNNTFADYNPITLLTQNQAFADVLNSKASQVQQLMMGEIGDRVKVTNVIVPIVLYDQPTQAAIQAYQAQVGKTRTADQAVLTAQAQAKANEILSKSLQNTGVDVLISKCLDLVQEGKTVPGWCFPPGSGTLVNTGTGAK